MFNQVKKISIFKLLVNFLSTFSNNFTKSSIKKSKIIDVSQIKEDDYRIISLRFLKKIFDIISDPSTKDNEDKMQ